MRTSHYRSGVERRGLLTVDELRAAVASDDIDTVLVGFADMHGRLQGKRFHARFFVDEVLEHGTEACNYLLAVDVDMTPADGYAMSSWDAGYGDFVLEPDLSTLRSIPWHPGTAMVMADVRWEDGSPVVASPRQILRAQLERLAARGWQAMVGTELELIIFQDSYEDAWRRGYRDLTPGQPVQRRLLVGGHGARRAAAAPHPQLDGRRRDGGGVGQGECNLGQHEIAFRYDDALTTCDNHSIYKAGAKEIAAQEGMALTFMAKFNEREGNSCHIHFSLRDGDDVPVMAGDRDHGFSPVMEQFLAGQLACQRELTLLFAPNINSVQALSGRVVRADGGRVGARQPDLRVARRRPRPVAALRASCARRRRQPVPRRRGTDRRRVARSRALARPRGALHLERVRAQGCPHPVDAARSGRAVGVECSGPRRSATRSSTTTPTWPASSSRRSTPPSPTGSATGGSSAFESVGWQGRRHHGPGAASASPRASVGGRRCSRRVRRRRCRQRASGRGRGRRALRPGRRDRRGRGRGAVRRGRRAYGGIDVSFHNAGISPTDDDSILDTPSTCGGGCRRSTSPPCTCAAGT